MKIDFINIKSILQTRNKGQKIVSGIAMSQLPRVDNAYMSIEEDTIVSYGQMSTYKKNKADMIIDVSGKMILPTWIDSHTHLVYAGTREEEFKDRIKGLSYQEIAEKGGGILNSAHKLQATPEKILYEVAAKRLHSLIKLGTGAVEIKSGYGLTHDAELKMLRVIQKLKDNSPIPISVTYLAAHAIPIEFKENKSAYIDTIINKTLPVVAKENLCEYVDVFCEKGYFDLEDTDRILKAAKKYGIRPKIHVNQFNAFGGVKKAIEYNALSVDHLEELTEEDIIALQNSTTLPVALPGCSFFLGIPYTPARQIIDNNLPLVLASDYNPGSAPSGNMNFVIALACIKMKLSPEEAINAATINAAAAVEKINDLGSITIGKKANFIITKNIPSITYLPYSFGENLIEQVYINGQKHTG